MCMFRLVLIGCGHLIFNIYEMTCLSLRLLHRMCISQFYVLSILSIVVKTLLSEKFHTTEERKKIPLSVNWSLDALFD